MRLLSDNSMNVELQARIIKQATRMFMCNGIKSITMDMIASQLGISKRTLYENFKDKDELVLACLDKDEQERKARFNTYFDNRKNIIDLLLNIHEDFLRFAKDVSPMFFVDLERYCSKVNDKYEDEKERHRRETVDLLKIGVGEGVIRDDINIDIVATLLTAQFELLKKSDQVFGSEYTFTEIFETIFKNFIRGIATPEGVKYTDEFFAEKKK